MDTLERAAGLGQAGHHAQALALLDHALRTRPDHPALHTARGWALENLGPMRWAEARSAYESAIALDAEELWARLGLATVLGQTGASAQCPPIYRDLVRRATPRADSEPEYIELLGWCQYRLGRLDEAAATFERGLSIDAGWPSVRFDLGLVLLLNGDARSAAVHYGHALETLAAAGRGLPAGPVQVALDDLDEALTAHPGAAAAAAPLRRRLLDALRPEVDNA